MGGEQIGWIMDYIVKNEEDGRKIRDVLRRGMGVSYSAMKSAKWGGRIRLNGQPVHTDAIVRAGDTVSIDWAEDAPVYALKGYDLPLEVPYEDEHLAVIVKPSPLASQSSRNHPDDSLENALYSYYGRPEGFVYRPVNRLDKGTGGLMVVARTPHAQHLMQRQLHSPAFRRRYLALTDGVPAEREGVIDLPIAKAPEASVKRIIDPAGKTSITRYRVLRETDGGGALVLLELETGRTHQIRVHLSAIGCPVHGDFLYGREDPERFPGKFALHSAFLEFLHPITGKEMSFRSVPEWAGESFASADATRAFRSP